MSRATTPFYEREYAVRALNHLAALLLTVLAPIAGAACKKPAFRHEKKDASTILALESGWNAAFLSGDTDSMGCLLTANFTEIMRNGNVLHRNDELAMAERNRDHLKSAPACPLSRCSCRAM